VYKIQSSHTIHMVKGVSRAGAAASSQPAAPQPLPTMQAGQDPHDPLTQLNSHQGYGLMAGLNPFADMGLNPNDPNMVGPPPRAPYELPVIDALRTVVKHDELAAVLAANVEHHVQPCCARSDHSIQSSACRYGSASQGGFPE
jgi:hypothetical protein